jgi:hypothetical protein
MPRIALPEGACVHCIVDDFLWPWDGSTPVLMMHGGRVADDRSRNSRVLSLSYDRNPPITRAGSGP